MLAARELVQSCLGNMGGKRPSDLKADPLTWVTPDDLMKLSPVWGTTFKKREAAGLFSSLEVKGFIQEEEPGKVWFVTDEGWRWMDTIWGSWNNQEV